MRRPPRVATWLLQRLACGPEGEALAGDLIEQYQRGRSAVWYHAQVAWAIVAGAAEDARQHYVLAIRAVILWYLLAWITAQVALEVYGLFGQWIWNWTVAHDWNVLRIVWFGRVRWTSPPLLLMSCVNSAMIGWVIARFHPRHVGSTLLTTAAVMIAYVLARPGWPAGLWPLLFAPMPFIPTIPYLIALIGAPLGLVCGGLLAGARNASSIVEGGPA
jgi:hypothetical protein